MAPDPAQVRQYLLMLARQEDKRDLDWPHDWKPYEVNDPESGQPFTNESAWDLIVQWLESGVALIPRVQNRPQPGIIAYEMIACLSDGWSVYVKIRPGKKDRIFGRSFHYDERQL